MGRSPPSPAFCKGLQGYPCCMRGSGAARGRIFPAGRPWPCGTTGRDRDAGGGIAPYAVRTPEGDCSPGTAVPPEVTQQELDRLSLSPFRPRVVNPALLRKSHPTGSWVLKLRDRVGVQLCFVFDILLYFLLFSSRVRLLFF